MNHLYISWRIAFIARFNFMLRFLRNPPEWKATHTILTGVNKYIISAESGNVIIWNRLTEMVLFKEEQPGVKQLTLLENDTKFLTVSNPPQGANSPEVTKINAIGILRSIPDGTKIYSFELPMKNISGSNFRPGVITCDGQFAIFFGADKGNKDALYVFNARTGSSSHKIQLRHSGIKDALMLVAMPNKASMVAVIDPEKGSIFDIKTKRLVRTIPKWGGTCTRDGKTGLYAPPRGGLELLELRKGFTVKTFIPKVAEGVFSVICLFNKTDEYVMYYHSGRKTLRVFRTSDAQMIANFRVQAELSAVESTDDGKCIVLGTVDGCLSVFAIADPQKSELKDYLNSLPSRDEQWKKKINKMKATTRFKAAASIAKLSAHFANSNCNSEEEEEE